MIYIEFTMSALLAVIALYAQEEKMPKRSELSHLWNSCPKWLRLVLLFALALSPSIIGCINNRAAQIEQEANEVYKRNQQASLDEANNRLVAATNKIEVQARMLVEQSATIADQSRTIGSIAYNTQTTLEGKQRFIRCFRDLTRLTKLNREGMIFEGLICGDGVAMYWFKQDTEQMEGFHFFSNSELNRVLSGIPSDTLLFSEDGTLNIDPKSELAIALNESLYGKTPTHKDNPIDQDRARDAIIDEVKVLLEYVFRAKDIKINPVCRASNATTPLCATVIGIELSFEYVVKPAAAKPYTRFVKGVVLSNDELNSLQGVDKVAFSKRVINHWRAQKIEPKVKIRDIRCLNLKHLKTAQRQNSPFEVLEAEGR